MKYRELTPDDVAALFEQYKDGIDEIRSREQALLTAKDPDTWNRSFRALRSAERSAFENGQQMTERFMPYLSGIESLGELLAESFYNHLLALDLSRYDDPFFHVRIVQCLIGYYEESNDIDRLVLLYDRLGWEQTEMVRRGYRPGADAPFAAYRRALKCREAYAYLNPAARRGIFLAYYNIACVLPEVCGLSMELSAECFREALDFWQSRDVRSVDAENADILHLVRRIKENWLNCESEIGALDEDTVRLFCDTADEVFETSGHARYSDLYNTAPQIILARLRTSVIRGRMKYTDALRELLNLLFSKSRSVSGPELIESDRHLHFETAIGLSLIRSWLTDPLIPETVRGEMTHRIITSMEEQFRKAAHSASYSPELNRAMADWCFAALPYMQTAGDREKALSEAVINRQPAAFFHAHMTKEISKQIAESVVAKNPDLFLGMPGFSSIYSIYGNKTEIIRFVAGCAMFRDLGKDCVADVVLTRHRPLTEEEEWVLNHQAEAGASALEGTDDERMRIYRRIMTMNRETDSPSDETAAASAKESSSYLKMIADIVSVAAQIDTATDPMGPGGGSDDLGTVIAGICGGENTFSYDLIDIISSDTDLYRRIYRLVTEERTELYWEFYSSFFGIET